jgi:type IV secretory pathway VirB4 component
MNAHPATLRRELSAAQRIPNAAHVSPHIVKTALGDYVQVLRLGGASFECADDETLNTWHERLNVLWRNIASPQVALWTHVIRRREVTSVGEGGSPFANVLEAKYRERLAHQTLMVNELYLSTVYRPTAGVATSLAAKLISRTRVGESTLELADALDACEKLRETVRASLARYDPETLTVYSRAGREYSAPLTFFALLVNGESVGKVPGRFDVFAWNPHFPVSAREAFDKRLRGFGNRFLVHMDADMLRREHARKKGERTIPFGVGVYRFELGPTPARGRRRRTRK